MRVFFIFFFFQAEDGIRDIGVTGVQTCALPILDGARDGGPGERPEGVHRHAERREPRQDPRQDRRPRRGFLAQVTVCYLLFEAAVTAAAGPTPIPAQCWTSSSGWRRIKAMSSRMSAVVGC